MAVEKTLLALFGVVLVCLCYYNLLRAIPDQHALVMKENFELQQKLQQRIHPIASDPLPLPVEANNRGELDQCQDKLREQLQISESLRNTLTENQANPLTPATTPQCNMGEKNRPLPLLILCHNRPDYLQRTLDNIIANRPSSQQFPIIVSQDGTHDGVWKLLNGPKYYQEVTAIQLQERGKASTSYHYIAQHFKFGISSVLEKLGFEDVIILEDDMEIAPDFFQYFLRMREELYKDESLYTASAWNDNGQNDHGRDPQNLKRSDFFPGLGWIMTGKLWKELGPKWPEGYWDDWMREPAQRKGRHCIFPEISRSWTFGEQGSSQGQFWKQYLKPVTLYSGPPVAFNSLDLSYLNDEHWHADIRHRLTQAKPISTHTQVNSVKPEDQAVIIEYSGDRQFDTIAKFFNIMYDEKAGIHRTAYKGIVYFWYNDREVYLAEKGYKEIFHL